MRSKSPWVFLLISLWLLSACRPAIIVPAPEVPGAPPAARPPEAVQDELRRRKQVAAALTDEGRSHLAAGRLDAAMRVFEQALAQSPHFGPAYYYLAECWLRKDNAAQAYAFHDQAELYLSPEPSWRDRLRRQKTALDVRFSALPRL